MVRTSRRVGVCLALAAVMICAGAARAQEITGTVTGTVKDESGAVIPGATVTLRNLDTSDVKTLVTDSSGVYVFPLLLVGHYEVTVELPGFRKFVRSGLDVHANDRIRVDATLVAGAIEETVTVVGASPVVQTESSDVSTLINATQVAHMPLNGRNIISLVQMQPGVASNLPGTLGVGLQSLQLVYVNGQRASQNNWMIDGADNNDAGSNLGLINYVNVDTVAEVKILRANYNAEFGRSGGGQISVVTKSGSNAVNGSLFEFLRNDAFDARNIFSFIDFDGDGKADPAPLRYNNFGGTVGGPIQRDRLFFFWGEEVRRMKIVRGGGVVNTRVATERQRAGDFSGLPAIIDPTTGQPFPGNRIPDNRIDPLARALLNRFPLPNADPAALGGGRNFSAATGQRRNFREELARVDYKASSTHSVYGRYINDSIPSEEPFGEIFGGNNAAFPGISNTKTNKPGRNFVGTWNWIVSPTMLNEVSYNYSRGAILSEMTGNFKRDVNVPKVFSGTPGDQILPGIAFGSGNYGGFNFFGPYDNTFGSHRVKETLTKSMGPHALKFGFLYSFEFKNENAASGTNGSFVFPGTSSAAFTSTGDAFADFLLGRASSYSENNIDITSHLRYEMIEAFAQDDWKLRPNVTINAGVRWSVIRPPYDTETLLTNFDPAFFNSSRAYQISAANVRVPGTGDPLNGLVIAGQNSPEGKRVAPTHWNTFGPRLGLAWDPFEDGKTSVRAGYGMYFDRTLVGIFLQNAFVNPPFAFSAVFSAAGAAGNPTLSNPRGGAERNNEAIVPNLIATAPDFKIPTTHQFSAGVQRELPWNFSLDVGYVGTRGRNWLRPYDLNKTPPGTTSPTNAARPFRGFGNITLRDTSAKTEYDSLQLSVTRRFIRGLQVTTNYTLSRAEGNASSDRNAGDLAQDPR
ncbi:MAG: carboxypeptidase regulatory-like domain-containing protein, partial [Acidobacteria bacterium]|nr:carboxypeptidase regulatory-like domain-containing protein [Acidobacteriota bacterium]